MTRRLLTAGATLAALLLAAAAWAGPKPPDLPLQPQQPLPPLANPEMPPQAVAPLPRPNLPVDDAGMVIPAQSNAMPVAPVVAPEPPPPVPPRAPASVK